MIVRYNLENQTPGYRERERKERESFDAFEILMYDKPRNLIKSVMNNSCQDLSEKIFLWCIRNKYEIALYLSLFYLLVHAGEIFLRVFSKECEMLVFLLSSPALSM